MPPAVALRSARAAWFVLVPAVILGNIVGFVLVFQDPNRMQTPHVQAAVADLNLPLAAVIGIGLALPFAISAAISAVIFLRRSRDPRAILFSITIALLGTYFLRGLVPLKTVYPSFEVPVRLVWTLALISIAYLMLTFPTGTFYPRWSRWIFALAAGLIIAVPQLPEALQDLIQNDLPHGSVRVAVFLVSLLPPFVVAAQVARFRNSGPTEKQQIRWGLLPTLVLLIYVFMLIIVPSLVFDASSTWVGIVTLASTPIGVMVPLGLARAILSYRLYEIDMVVNRALVYSSLTIVLAIAYLGTIVLLQQVLSPVAKESDLAIVGSTLLVAALFRPLRSTLQNVIDRRFYRRKYDSVRTLEEFAVRLRQDVDLLSLRSDLLGVVSATVQPVHASLWLRTSRNDSQTLGG